MVAEFAERFRTQVREFVVLPVAPDVLHRIELRRVAGQRLQRDPAALGTNVLLHDTTAVRGEPVPDDEELAAQMALQVHEEFDDLRPFDRAREQPEVEAPPELLEEPPDVPRVILHAARLLDQHGDAPRGPETRVEAERLGTALESLLDAPELDGAELRLAPRAARLLQASAAGYHQLPRPAIHRLPMDTDLPGDFRFAQAPLEERRRVESPRLQR